MPCWLRWFNLTFLLHVVLFILLFYCKWIVMIMKACLKNKVFQMQNSVSIFIWLYQRFLWLPYEERFLSSVALSTWKVVHVTCKSPSWFVYASRETSPVSFPWFLLSMHFSNVTDKFKDLFYQLNNSCAILFDWFAQQNGACVALSPASIF